MHVLPKINVRSAAFSDFPMVTSDGSAKNGNAKISIHSTSQSQKICRRISVAMRHWPKLDFCLLYVAFCHHKGSPSHFEAKVITLLQNPLQIPFSPPSLHCVSLSKDFVYLQLQFMPNLMSLIFQDTPTNLLTRSPEWMYHTHCLRTSMHPNASVFHCPSCGFQLVKPQFSRREHPLDGQFPSFHCQSLPRTKILGGYIGVSISPG